MLELELSDDQWQAIQARDERCDGEFVYAVITTGVYCRPACSARKPRRQNVVVFSEPKAAEAAGFRACRRCRPRRTRTSADEKVSHARTMIEQRINEDPDSSITLAELGEYVGWSPAHLQRSFNRILGLSPRSYADALRVERAKSALRAGETVLASTYEGGFGSGKALYDRSVDAFGMTPGTYRRGGDGVLIRYAVFDTALGSALVAATDCGVCAVSLGDDPDVLIKELEDEFPAAKTVLDDETVGPWAEPVLRVLAGAPGHPSADDAGALLALPTDVRGTVFQRRVWSALRDIPVGETRTYAEVAEAIGHPGSARAVAGACGANRLALVVPCHRVIGSDGDLRGYRWGKERKRAILEREQQEGDGVDAE